MDYTNSPVPPIPKQSRHQSRQKALALQNPPSSSRPANPRRLSIPPSASPEVISSLITSLSDISKSPSTSPTNLSGLPPTSLPPGSGSFGVDYGAFSQPLDDPVTDVSLDELAASPPIIKTAKPPSGFSPLTAPKSPGRESTGSGLKSILRANSRPSSKGSVGSRDDTQSIGNLSVERGTAPTHELRRQSSHDSWGRKQGRAHKGLMYMSSKERLREKEHEKKRGSIGATSGSPGSGQGLATRLDPILAEAPITEERGESPPRDSQSHPRSDLSPNPDQPLPSPRPIPARDSSLRKSSQPRRSSTRNPRSKRDSGDALSDAILEIDEPARTRESSNRRSHQNRGAVDAAKPAAKRSAAASPPPIHRDPSVAAKKAPPSTSPVIGSSSGQNPSRQSVEMRYQYHAHLTDLVDVEDSAPFPAVAQGRRRESSEKPGRKSGRHTPDPVDTIRLKRSSSRLKRLSGPLSPRSDDHSSSHGASTNEPANPMPNGYERPRSADSIDDAVESYLCSPRLSQKIRHPQTGRVISFSEVGDSEGSAVFCCVGMGLTRYITAFYDELALTLKLRLITPDRPGVGDSEPYADGTATPLSWPDDVYAICQALKINKFSILAHSAGAIYALATALRMPQHIRGRIHLLAPWIPPSQMNVFGASQALPPTNAIPTSQRILRALPTPLLKAANSSFMSATSSSITSSLPKTQRRGKRKSNTNRDAPTTVSGPGNGLLTPDKENFGHSGRRSKTDQNDDGMNAPGAAPMATENMDLVRPTTRSHISSDNSIVAAAANAMADKERQVTYDNRLTHAIWELATTGANPAVDLLVCLERRHTIGFRYVDITRPVVIHHGSRDTRVPVDNVRWLGKTMRRCEVRVLEGEGHGLMASAGVMGSVLMEISKEWEDWMRVTGTGTHGRNQDRGRRPGTSVR